MKIFFTFFTICLINFASAQNNYWLTFKDKSASVFSIDNPEEFLSKNALARRNKFSIAISFTDLPVCKTYIQEVRDLGIEVNKKSNWLNACLIIVDDTLKLKQLKLKEFVKEIQYLGKTKIKNSQYKFQYTIEEINTKSLGSKFGAAQDQIEMLRGDSLHNLSYRGKGIDIAVMDNGFPSVDTNRFYQKAFSEGRITAVYDFVNDNDTLFDSENGSHGNFVISTMVSDIEGEMIGTAPEANYFLFSTEDANFEGLPEEYNWALAAEMADSVLGVNAIISTSLGYSDGFDIESTNHTYSDMDGNTTPITIAADLAASKGILVVNSAGNSGNNSWHYITAPSDGDSVLCVGAVNPLGEVTNFSSRGPSADGDIKPNVCAQGGSAKGVNVFEKVVSINGTSFSCPITAGMAACLWQAFPDKNNMEIINAIETSAHLYATPNDDYGYGIPNFYIAYVLLSRKNLQNKTIIIFPNPIENKLNFIYKNENNFNGFSTTIVNINGEIVRKKEFKKDTLLHYYSIGNLDYLSKGTYFLLLNDGKDVFKTKFLKK